MIRITENYIIDVEEKNYTVKEDKHRTVTDKNGKVIDVYEVKGYYGSLTGAIKAVRDLVVANSLAEKEMTLNEAISVVEGANKSFEDKLKDRIGDV